MRILIKLIFSSKMTAKKKKELIQGLLVFFWTERQ